MFMKHAAATVALTLLTLAPAFPANAQGATGQSPKIAPGTLIEPTKTFDAMLTGFEREFTGAAKAMPAESYSFAPTSATFGASQKTDYKGVKTFAQEVTHVTQANYYYGKAFSSLKVDADLKKVDALTNKDEILAALAASFVYLHQAMATLTAKNAFESINESETRATLAGGVVAHGFDHYGQMVEYLRMNGIVPPASVR